jgi:DNA transposition AAA+ family ATPase
VINFQTLSKGVSMSVRERFNEWLQQGHTLRFASRAMNVQETRLSQWKNGRYNGTVEPIERAAEAFLRREKEKQAANIKKAPFVMTSVAARVFEIARICHIDGEVGVATAEAGHGKTYAVKQYARMNPDVILIEADQGYTACALFTSLHRMLCSHNGREQLHDMVEDVIERLKGSGRLIIVDEAENLPTKALDLLRRVYDKAEVGILLTGMPRLEANLRGKRGEFAQLHSRVGVHARIGAITEDDAASITREMLADSNGVYKDLYVTARKNARSLVLLIKRARAIARINSCDINADVVTSASRMLML